MLEHKNYMWFLFKYKKMMLIVFAVLLVIGLFVLKIHPGQAPILPAPLTPIACTEEAKLCPDGSAVGRSGPNCEFSACPTAIPAPKETTKITDSQTTDDKKFLAPLDNVSGRATKKTFGLKISPQNSPISPEKFSGYHTGLDLETTVEEADKDLPILAICNGKLVLKKKATGYGGVAVQQCLLNDKTITVVYGHLRLNSISARVGDKLKAGQVLGVLGQGFSPETDGERKHLHLGIHLGSSINLLGYVKNNSALADWLDPLPLITN